MSAPPTGNPAGRPVHRAPVDRSPLEHALIAWLGSLVAIGGGWLWVLFASGPRPTAPVAWGGGATALAACALIALATYHAVTARRLRARLTEAQGGTVRLERQIYELSEGALPEVVRQVRAGEPAEAALNDVPAPASPALQRVLHGVAHEIAAAERTARSAEAALKGIEDETGELLASTFPKIAKLMRGGRASADTALAEVPHPDGALARRLLHDVAHHIADGERASGSTRMASANAAARLQGAATRMLAELRELEFRYDEQPVFDDLLDLDHGVCQMGRLADSIAILCGGRSGRRWTRPIIMESILRGAMGRIAQYRRLRMHSACEAAIVGNAAEGVMHALAELMDNATMFSTCDTEVHVYVEEVDAGIVVTIEDGGIGMRTRERARAQRLVTAPTSITNLPGTRIGLPVVGRLAVKHGLRISFRPSARGGIGAVVLIPRHLVTQPRPRNAPRRPPRTLAAASAPSAPSAASAPSAPSAAIGPGPSGDRTPDELPRRPVGLTYATSPEHLLQPAAERPHQRGAPGARFAAFRQAGERTPSTPGHDGPAAQDDR